MGSGARRGQAGVIARPTRRSPAARTPSNDVPAVVPRRRRRAVRLATGAGGVDARADMMTTRIDTPADWSHRATKWPLAGACQRSSYSDWGYVGKRAFDKAFLPNHSLRRLPLAASVGHQGQRCRALLM